MPNLIWFSVIAIILHPVFRKLGARRIEAAVKVRGYPGQFRIRIGTTDPICFLEVILEEEYRTAVELCIARGVGIEGDLILDLGSNVGYSLRYLMEYFPGAALIGVEPNQDNFQILMANIRRGLDSHRVKILRNAVSGRREIVSLDSSAGAWATKTIQTPSDGEPARIVEALTIPELLERAGHSGVRIALLKYDIEGAEEKLLNKSPDWLWKTEVFAIESHAPYWATCLRDDIESHCPGRFEFTLEDENVFGRALV